MGRIARMLVVVTLLGGLPWIPAIGQSEVDFSGVWVRNSGRSIPGRHVSMNSIPVSIEINQKPGVMHITSTQWNRDSATTVLTSTFITDGIARELINSGALKRKARFQWTEDHQGFTTEITVRDSTGKDQPTSRRFWSLTGDGKLQIEVELYMNGEEHDLLEIFDRR